MNNIVNLKLELNPCAWIVAEILNTFEPDFADYCQEFCTYNVEFETKPLYNGRERGLVFSMNNMRWQKMPQLNIFVYESRNTDNICATVWEGKTFNGWDSKDIPITDEQYRNGEWVEHHEFYNEHYKMAKWIYVRFAKHYNTFVPAEDGKDGKSHPIFKAEENIAKGFKL